MEKQRVRARAEVLAPVGGGFDDGTPDASDALGGTVAVTHGPYAENLPVGGMTVGEIRRRFHDRLDIHPQAAALVDGAEADENTTVRTGQLLMFVRRSGEKGGGPWTRS